jgi:hypothetical protein
MNRIKGLDRELEPAAMHPEHPIMGKDKDARPGEQNQVVKANTPKKNVLDHIRRHNIPPISKTKENTDGGECGKSLPQMRTPEDAYLRVSWHTD